MIFFRADGNSKIGAGHVMRCLSIACEALKTKEQIIFYTASADFSTRITENHIKNIVIESDFMDMESELVFFKKEIDKFKPKYIFVDSYYVTKKYLSEILNCCHKYGGKLVYLDDIMLFAYPCDYLINYNIFGPDMEKRYIKLYLDEGISEDSSDFPKMLLGLYYLPLREEFANIPPRVFNNNKNILVSTGGADTEHVALEIARVVSESSKQELREYIFHILIGAKNRDKVKIEEIAHKCDSIQTHYNVKNMVDLMLSCDLAISAAGSTLYELCATQTPTITYVVADNQILMAKTFCEKGIMDYIGDIRKKERCLMIEKLILRAIELGDDFNYRREISKRQGCLIKKGSVNNIICELQRYE